MITVLEHTIDETKLNRGWALDLGVGVDFRFSMWLQRQGMNVISIDPNQGIVPPNIPNIYFEPKEEIFNDGTNPLFLVDELQSLGDSKVYSHFNKVPDIENIDVTKCYVYWEVLLATIEDVNVISDVFIFVEDECKLEINQVADKNILEDENIIQEISTLAGGKNDVGLSEVISTLGSLREKRSRHRMQANCLRQS